MDPRPTPDDFRQHLNVAFRADAGGPEIVLHAVHESDDRELREENGLAPGFLVLFRGPREPLLPEGLHRLTSATGGDFSVYIIPIQTMGPTRQDYQVVFG